jgi:hypothetical protein
MAIPSNIFQTVQTYQKGELAYLQNYACMISTFNKRFKNFQNETANLGSSITFDLPPRAYAQNSLVINFQQSVQRVQTLTVDQEIAVGRAITAEQLVFNDMESYMKEFGRSDMMELANNIERNLALNAISAVPLAGGAGLHTESGPTRFYGDGKTAINSYGQIANMLAQFRELGAGNEMDVYLPAIKVPDIINSGLNQFVMKRNEETAMSWMLGEFDGARYLRSNLMPVQNAGNVGNLAQTLTVVSTNDPTGANITSITFSGATANDQNAIKSGDLGQISFNVANQPNVYALTFYGHVTTGQPVQFRATANAIANGSGDVTVTITPALNCQSGSQTQNISTNIVAGMQVTFLPTHRAGMLVNSNGAFLAMPRLPECTPYPSATMSDPKTGAAIRSYYGVLPFQNQYGYAHDAIFGSTVVPEYSLRIAFPL